MRRFAANRLCNLADLNILRNQVVEIDETDRKVVGVFTLEEEIRHTEWLGGIFILSNHVPVRRAHESFADFLKREAEVYSSCQEEPLKAYHITAFDVRSMEFTSSSRIVLL